jgi:hypothetical protein
VRQIPLAQCLSRHRPRGLLALSRLAAAGKSDVSRSDTEARLADLVAKLGATSNTSCAGSPSRGPDDLDDDLAVTVSQRFSARTSSGRAVYELHGRRLAPRPGTQPPAVEHIIWHRRQVFQGLPLAS